jgi:hypothetical protein
MIHVRHGIEIGRVEGHYDEYGRVVEQKGLPEAERYRGSGDGQNGHSEICRSEFEMGDSHSRLQGLRVYGGEEMRFGQYAAERGKEPGKPLDGPNAEKRREREFAALPVPLRDAFGATLSRCVKEFFHFRRISQNSKRLIRICRKKILAATCF